MPTNVVLSLIFPLPDHRGYFDEVFASWLQNQTLAPDRYEFLLVSGPTDAGKLESLRPLLRKQDQAWVEESDGILFLIDCAARRARGDVLVMTESHVIAHPECLENIEAHFRDHERQLGQCFHINFLETRFAEMEQRLEGILIGRPEEPYWNYVRKRGFAIRRELYLSLGGFEHEYGYFSERVFAYRLLEAGHRSGFLEDAVVYHYNTPSLGMMQPHHQDYAVGMCLYRETLPSHEAETAFGPLQIWDQREQFRTETRSLVRQAHLASWRRRKWADPAFYLRMRSRMILPLSGHRFWNRGDQFLARCLTSMTRGSEGRTYHWYRRFWHAIVRGVHLETIERNLAGKTLSRETGDLVPPLSLGAKRITDFPHFGFHPLEKVEGREMRWTGVTAFVRLPVALGEGQRIRLHLHPAGPGAVENACDVLWREGGDWNEGRWDEEGRVWTVTSSRNTSELCLVLISWNPSRFPGDNRELGVAVERIALGGIDE